MTEGVINVDVVVDARGLNCPLPVLKARKALMDMATGQVLKVIATDPTSAEDFPVFAKATKHSLLDAQVVGDEFVYYLQVT